MHQPQRTWMTREQFERKFGFALPAYVQPNELTLSKLHLVRNDANRTVHLMRSENHRPTEEHMTVSNVPPTVLDELTALVQHREAGGYVLQPKSHWKPDYTMTVALRGKEWKLDLNPQSFGFATVTRTDDTNKKLPFTDAVKTLVSRTTPLSDLLQTRQDRLTAPLRRVRAAPYAKTAVQQPRQCAVYSVAGYTDVNNVLIPVLQQYGASCPLVATLQGLVAAAALEGQQDVVNLVMDGADKQIPATCGPTIEGQRSAAGQLSGNSRYALSESAMDMPQLDLREAGGSQRSVAACFFGALVGERMGDALASQFLAEGDGVDLWFDRLTSNACQFVVLPSLAFTPSGDPLQSESRHVATYVWLDNDSVLYFDTLNNQPNPRVLTSDQIRSIQLTDTRPAMGGKDGGDTVVNRVPMWYTKYVTEAKCMEVPDI